MESVLSLTAWRHPGELAQIRYRPEPIDILEVRVPHTSLAGRPELKQLPVMTYVVQGPNAAAVLP